MRAARGRDKVAGVRRHREKAAVRGTGRTAAARVRDVQRARLYAFEDRELRVLAWPQLSLAACRGWVGVAYAFLEGPGAEPPRVTDGRGRRHAAGSREVIHLPRWARRLPVVLHECAHGVTPDRHGPLFVRAYVELLVVFAGYGRLDLETAVRRAGLRIAPRAALFELLPPASLAARQALR